MWIDRWRDNRTVDVENHPDRSDRLEPAPVRVRHLHFLLSRRVEIMASVLLVGAAALVPWTVFLGLSLPGTYDAGHWSLLWTGFDVVLLSVLGYAGWAAWFRRQILATTAIVAGTLLLCDAWFDTITSIGNRDEWLSLLTGFGAEIPLAVLFLCLYRHMPTRTSIASPIDLNGQSARTRSDRRQPNARSRLYAALINARWVNACGKFPCCSPAWLICSANNPTWLA